MTARAKKTKSVTTEKLTLCRQASSQFHLLMQVMFTHMSQTSKERCCKAAVWQWTRTDAGNAFDGNLPNAFLKAREPRVNSSDLSLLPLYELLDDLWLDGEPLSPHVGVEKEPTQKSHLLLLLDDDRELCVRNARIELAAHECGPLIIFDVAHIFDPGDLDILWKTLKLEESC